MHFCYLVKSLSSLERILWMNKKQKKPLSFGLGVFRKRNRLSSHKSDEKWMRVLIFRVGSFETHVAVPGLNNFECLGDPDGLQIYH